MFCILKEAAHEEILRWRCVCCCSFLPPRRRRRTRSSPRGIVPDYVRWLLEVAGEEVGYREGDHGWSKYGEWAGDPYAQWCAEFLCWCVDQVDQRHGTHLLGRIFPLYSGQNTGPRLVHPGRALHRPQGRGGRLGI